MQLSLFNAVDVVLSQRRMSRCWVVIVPNGKQSKVQLLYKAPPSRTPSCQKTCKQTSISAWALSYLVFRYASLYKRTGSKVSAWEDCLFAFCPPLRLLHPPGNGQGNGIFSFFLRLRLVFSPMLCPRPHKRLAKLIPTPTANNPNFHFRTIPS